MTQLYATIKKTSRYAIQQTYHLDSKGKPVPFPVEIGTENGEMRALGGVGGNYAVSDLNYFINYRGKFVRFKG